MDHKLISADSHINEPPDLWRDRVPEKYRTRAPQMVSLEQGDAWIMETSLDPINFGGNCSAGLPVEQRSAWIRWEEVRPGGYLPGPRIEEQDQDGVDAEVLYPTPRIGNSLFYNNADPDFHVACIRAYNDWLSEFCAHDPTRLVGVAMLPNCGVEATLAELERIKGLPGMRGALIGQYPHGGEVIDEQDDRVWAAAAEAGIPISIHVAFATQPQGDKKRMKVTGAMRFFDAPVRLTQFVESGVFDRVPDLQLLLVEVDCSWVPYLTEQMDDRFGKANPATRPALKRMPSEYFQTNIGFTFITDKYGIDNRDRIGVERMMWSSDHPHGGSDWPESWKTIDDHFDGVPEDEKQLILAGNAKRFYGLD